MERAEGEYGIWGQLGRAADRDQKISKRRAREWVRNPPVCVGSHQHLFLLLPLHEFSKQRFGFFGRWFIPSSRRNRARKFGGLRDCSLGKLWNQDEKDEHNNRRNTDTCDKADNADQANVRAATNQARCLGILGVEVAFWADVSHLPSQRQTMARRRRRPGEPAWSSLSHLGLDKSKYDSAPSRFSL